MPAAYSDAIARRVTTQGGAVPHAVWIGRARARTIVFLSVALSALLINAVGAGPAGALLRWTTYEAGRTAQIGVPDSQLLLEHDGARTLVWAAEGHILARRSVAAGWGEVTTVADVDGRARVAGVVDDSGVVTIAWVESRARSTAIRSATFDAAWSNPVEVVADARTSAVSEVGISLALVDGLPCLVASTGTLLDETRPRQVAAYVFGGSWSEQSALPGVSERPGTAQAFTSGPYLGVTWTQNPGGQAVVAFLDPAAGIWGESVVLETGMPVSSAPLVAVGADDTGTTAGLVWGRFDTATATRTWRYALVEGATVGDAVDLQSGMANSARPTALWSHGSLWVSGPDPQGHSDVSRVWARGSLVVDESVSTPGLVPHSQVLAMDGRGHPLMSWLASDPGSSVSIEVARRVDGAWQNDVSLVGARGGGVVSAFLPTVLWQRATGSAGRGDIVVSAYEDVPLEAPTMEKVRQKDGPAITARWKAPSDPVGVTGYVVQVRRGKGAWVSRAEVGPGVRTFTFRAAYGANYRVRVAASGDGERSAWSAAKAVTVPKKPKRPRP